MSKTAQAVKRKDNSIITTSIGINADTYDRAQRYMISEYKRTGKRVFLKDLVSPALDLYIVTLGEGGGV